MEVYVIQDTYGKRYIGQTKNRSESRFTYHISDARNGSPFRLHKAIRVLGADAFRLAAIVRVKTRNQANETERLLISEFRTNNREFGYNMSVGGYGVRHKRSSLVGTKHPDNCEHCRKSALYNLGKKRSPESRQKMRASAIKRFSDITEREKLRKAHLGKTLTTEHRAKLSIAMRKYRAEH